MTWLASLLSRPQPKRPADVTIARRVESDRARKASSNKRAAERQGALEKARTLGTWHRAAAAAHRDRGGSAGGEGGAEMLTALKIYLAIGALLAAAAIPHIKPSGGFRDWADMVGFIIATISFALAYPIYFIWGARRG